MKATRAIQGKVRATYVEERLYFSVVTLISADILLLAKDGDRFPHQIIHVSEISARCSVTWM